MSHFSAHKDIGYHTRLYADNSKKIVGGSFGGSLDMETANRLVNNHFTVTVKTSGTPVFVDREGREVTLYISVDAGKTDKGMEALKLWRKEKERKDAEAEERNRVEQAEIEDLLKGLTHE